MLSDVPRHFHYNAIQIDQDMDSLITAAYLQSFVPVVDDQETFIGLIKRSDIIAYIYRRYNKLKSKLSDIEQGNMTYSGGTWSGGF